MSGYSAEQEAVLDTIAKLQAKAKGTSNEHEAALFAAKAQELLAKHNLDEAALRAREGGASDPVIDKDSDRTNVAKWRGYIYDGCAKLYFCKLLKRGNRRIFVGKAHNVDVAESMAEWLCSVVVRMAREYSSDRATVEDFKRGAAVRLWGRLNELYKAQNPPSPTPSQTGTGLPALYNSEAKEADDYIEGKWGQLAKSRSRGLTMRGGGAAAGYDRAGSINLSSQVAERRSSRMIGRK